jgi:phosphorylcholine metabolism protein LicD
MTLKEQASQNLKDFVEILNELEITFWLDGGTLLGAYRDKDFCDSDEDDTDLCTWDNHLPLKQEIIKRAIEKGFGLLHEWELEICVGRGGARIDLFFNRKNGSEAYTHIYSGKVVHRFVVIPVKYYEKLEPISFKGLDLLAPSPVEEFLTLKYGDWKTPIHRSQYRCDNKDQNKFIRESYV